jgi:adenylosuccinate lyase
MIGRTHGVHAEPITFGLKLLTWRQELLRNRTRIEAALEANRVGKVSGAVGGYTNLHPALERSVCERLGLRPDPASTQVIARDRHAHYMLALAQLGASIERFATTIRSLQRTEIGELQEPFKAGQTGSSAMPHKKNPKSSEQLCGLSRVLRANAMAALENVALWDERDISHSSVERIILPDSSILAVYMLRLFRRTIEGLVVNAARMRANIDRTGGAIYSGRLLAALVAKGLARDEAYAIVQRLAIPAAEGGPTLLEGAQADPAVTARLKPAELEAVFDIDFYLQYVDEIFDRNLEQRTHQ